MSIFDETKELKILTVENLPKKVQDCPLEVAEMSTICQSLQNLCQKKNGLGLSAVQIGIPYRLFVLSPLAFNLRKGNYRYFVNTEYEPLGDEKYKGVEGCLSIPNQRFTVSRWSKIRVYGMELVKKRFFSIDYNFDIDQNGNIVSVFQHEIDHHRLITINQIGKVV